MAETVLIRCAQTGCGKEIGQVAYIPGKQIVSCPHCGYKTIVEINEKGKLYTTAHWRWSLYLGHNWGKLSETSPSVNIEKWVIQ